MDCMHTILEGTFAEFGSLFLKLFDGTLIDTTALVDKVSSGGGLARIDVADDYRSSDHRSDHRSRRTDRQR